MSIGRSSSATRRPGCHDRAGQADHGTGCGVASAITVGRGIPSCLTRCFPCRITRGFPRRRRQASSFTGRIASRESSSGPELSKASRATNANGQPERLHQ